ncbi:MAG: site-2 protease family protein [Nanoarchaeota archaeon]|nr:site-2 protease family protein [Nanoarchaeota archaeon]MCG2718517.1 site-2 protease family protein [Nanoarchaeota archaeon]
MNFDLLFAIIFYGLIYLFYVKNKKKFKVQGKIFFLYPTRLGLKLMDKVAKAFPRTLRILAYVSIGLGFLGMGYIFYILIQGTLNLLFVPSAAPTVAPVLPGIKIPGAPVLSFFHWIIAIFFVATVHEFSHGVFTRLYKIRVKSSGFAFLGPILAAFVEPDEKQIAKAKPKEQLAIYSAGPFSNFIFAVLFFLLFSFATGPLEGNMINPDGIIVSQLMEGYPAEGVGMEVPFVLRGINGKEILGFVNFSHAIAKLGPGEGITLNTDKGDFDIVTVENPDNESRGFIGISGFDQKTKVKKDYAGVYGTNIYNVLHWINLLVIWLFIINLGIGLFNLLPLGPVDGGRMFLTASLFIFKDAKKAKRFWSFVSMFCLLLIIINMLPWLTKLVMFLLKPFIFLISLLI